MDPLSITAGVVGVVTATAKCIAGLITVIEDVKHAHEQLQALCDDLYALQSALDSLRGLLSDHANEFAQLEIPLACCNAMCTSFGKAIKRVQGSSRLTSWAKLQLKEKEISTIRSNLGVYKSTITIAIGSINLRQHAATRQLIKEYQTLILTTSASLRQRIDALSEISLEQAPQQSLYSDISALTTEEVLDERRSAEVCLQICKEASMKLLEFSNSEAGYDATPRMSIHIAKQNFEKANDDLKQLKERFEKRLHDSGTGGDVDEETVADLKRGFAQCLSLCDRSMRAAENARISEYTGIAGGARAHQYIMSTVGDLLHVKDAKVQDDGLQVIGQVDGDVVRQISSDHARARMGSQSTTSKTSQTGTERAQPGFANRHGEGNRLGL